MEEAQLFKGGLEGKPVPGPHTGLLRARRSRGKGDTDGRIRALLRDHPRGLTADGVGRALSLSRRTAARRLDALARAKDIEVETYGQTRVFTLPRRPDLAPVLRKPAPLLLVLSPGFRVTGVNDPLLAAFRLGKGELVGKKIERTPLARHLGERVLKEIRKSSGGAEDSPESECFIGGTRFIFRARATPLSGPRGPAGTILSLEDVTANALHRRKIGELVDDGTLSLLSSNPRILEDLLRRREEEEQLRILGSSVDQAPVAALWIGKDGQLLRANQAAARLLGYPEEELGRLTWADLSPDQPAGTRGPPWTAPGTEPGAGFEGRFRTKGGASVPVAIRASRIRHGDREFGFVLAEDITRRREGDAALRASEAALREANRRLNLLVALTRHDALNDLAALGMYLSLPETGPAADDGAGVPGKVAALLRSLRTKLESTRDYTGLGISAPGWEDLSAAVGRGIAAVDTGPLGIDLDLPPLEIYRDPLFERAISNLVDNTLRHGGHATCLRVRAGIDGAGCTLLIEDDGAGISAEKKEGIFRPGQGRKAGPGLLLVREILGITGMDIRETGEPGKGARFEIRIPLGGFRKREESGGVPADTGGCGLMPGTGREASGEIS